MGPSLACWRRRRRRSSACFELSLSVSNTLSTAFLPPISPPAPLPHPLLLLQHPLPGELRFIQPDSRPLVAAMESYPVLLEERSIEAWQYNPTDEDQRLAHQYFPNRPVAADRLKELGVLSWKIDVENCECNPALEKIKSARGYKYWEVATVAPGKIENYEQKIIQFFQEHLHPYDESRLILDGAGYWDIRDYSGDWIRFRVEKGDLIVLPPGMYHRFTLDTENYIKALLLYTECPTRIDVMKPDGDELDVRKDYVKTVLGSRPPAIYSI